MPSAKMPDQLTLPQVIPQGPCPCRCHLEDPHKVYRPHCRNLGSNRYLRWCSSCVLIHDALDEQPHKLRPFTDWCNDCKDVTNHTSWTPYRATCTLCGFTHKAS